MKAPPLSAMAEVLPEKLKLYNYRCKLAASVLAKRAGKCKTLAEHIDLCFKIFRNPPLKYVGWSIAPMQIKAEIEALLTILAKRNIHVMLEIGTARGGTLYLFTKILAPDAIIVSLDLPSGDFGGGYPSYKKRFYTGFVRGDQRIFLVQADSHKKSSLESVKSILKGRQLDFLYIDGDHSCGGAKADFEMYGPLVRKGGLIAFHDIHEGTVWEVSGDIVEFWNEIQKIHPVNEIIADPNQDGYGIGLVYW